MRIVSWNRELYETSGKRGLLNKYTVEHRRVFLWHQNHLKTKENGLFEKWLAGRTGATNLFQLYIRMLIIVFKLAVVVVIIIIKLQ